MSGVVGYHAGVCAEQSIAQHYQSMGFKLVETRWRGQLGEIDLIAQRDHQLVFIEVKKSKSFSKAVLRLSQRQQDRIYNAAEEFIASRGELGFPDCRFDVALVDQTGAFKIVENAIGHH